jgi:hypothetical protein
LFARFRLRLLMSGDDASAVPAHTASDVDPGLVEAIRRVVLEMREPGAAAPGGAARAHYRRPWVPVESDSIFAQDETGFEPPLHLAELAGRPRGEFLISPAKLRALRQRYMAPLGGAMGTISAVDPKISAACKGTGSVPVGAVTEIRSRVQPWMDASACALLEAIDSVRHLARVLDPDGSPALPDEECVEEAESELFLGEGGPEAIADVLREVEHILRDACLATRAGVCALETKSRVLTAQGIGMHCDIVADLAELPSSDPSLLFGPAVAARVADQRADEREDLLHGLLAGKGRGGGNSQSRFQPRPSRACNDQSSQRGSQPSPRGSAPFGRGRPFRRGFGGQHQPQQPQQPRLPNQQAASLQ